MENKIATYEFPFVDGVDYDMVGVGEEMLSIRGRIMSFENFGSDHLVQLGQIRAEIVRQEATDFAHPEIGAFRVVVESFTIDQTGATDGFGFELKLKKATAI